jgi:hypothetical protein
MTAQGLQYLKRVVAQDKDTWFNICHKVTYEDGRPPVFPGNAHQNIRSAISDVMYWARKGYDVYLAMGAYLKAEHHSNRPYPTAIRQGPNLTACKCLYMDIDVKPEFYATTAEAAKAAHDFVRWAQLPTPCMVVMSGTGGFHIYWILDQLFEAKEFRHMAAQLVNAAVAFGLKFDAQCTTDPTRLLRVPGTWNFKKSEAFAVQLSYDTGKEIPLDEMRKALAAFNSATGYSQSKTSQKPSEPDANDDLTGGTTPDYKPANIDRVAEVCPFLANVLANGGKELIGEPQWHDMMALACHCEDPSATAHRLCKGNQYYTYEATEEKLASAQRTREGRSSLGPPKCKALLTNGAKECATCPHLKLDTTPLSVPFKVAAKTPPIIDLTDDLPPGYYRGNDDLIFKQAPDDGSEKTLCVFEYPLEPLSGYIEKSALPTLNFKTVQGGAPNVEISIDAGAFSDKTSFVKAFLHQALPITGNVEQSRTFWMGYLKLLRSKRTTFISVPPFGWSQDADGEFGFAFAGEFTCPSGVYRCVKPPEGAVTYNAIGDERPWRELADIVLTPDRPDLAVMAASAFAAPLISLSGEDGLLMGLWSSESGVGKSTSLKLAQAVYALPALGGMTDTVNYTFGKCAMLRHLPIIYDEIQTEDDIRSMVEVVVQLTQGREKGRLYRTGEAKPVRTFETGCYYAANLSLLGEVLERRKGTDAGGLRMFEMNALSSDHAGDRHFTSEGGRMAQALKLNYGCIGKRYAAFLGRNREEIVRKLTLTDAKLNLALQPLQAERYWIVAIATTIVGASIANALDIAAFPIREMWNFMTAHYFKMQKILLVTSTDFSRIQSLISALGTFLAEKHPRNMLILDRTWMKSYRPPENFAKILNDRQEGGWGKREVQISGDPLHIRISDEAISAWCKQTNRPKSAFIHGLKHLFGARFARVTIGSGCRLGGAGENCWLIDVGAGHPLEPLLEYTIHNRMLPP